MKNINVELLIFMSNNGSFCSTKDSFNSLLKSNSDIEIKGESLTFKENEFTYILSDGDVSDSQEKSKYFNIKLKKRFTNTDGIETFSDLVRQIKIIIGKTTDFPAQTLWDDISYYYAIQTYPLIHEIENILRKLITKFMLVNLGVTWPKSSVPDALKEPKKPVEKPSSKDSGNNHNILYDADFIKLSDFLFEEYKDYDVSELIKTLKEINIDATENKKDLEKILKFIPKSNWDRYFSKHINCTDDFLRKKWKRLYDLRCQIAHNNTFTKSDFEETKRIIEDIKPHLEKATEKLDVIVVSEQEKENLVDSIESTETGLLHNDDSSIHSLVKLTNELSHTLYAAAETFGVDDEDKGVYFLNMKLHSLALIDDEIFDFMNFIYDIRTSHDTMGKLDNFEIYDINKSCRAHIRKLKSMRKIHLNNKSKKPEEI
ncbi:TPA: hypothetical protein ACXJN2_001590 [Serratia marcescens]